VARILLHSLVFSPEANSTSYLMTDLARQLSAAGHEVTVLTTTPHNNLEAGALARQPLRSVVPGVLYRSDLGPIEVWHVKIPMKGDRVLRRVLDYIRFHVVSLGIGGTRVLGEYDLVLAPSPPLTIGIIGWLLALRRGVPSVYNVQEIYPDFAVNQGMIRNRAFIRLLESVERFVYARSAAVVPISEWFARTIRSRGVPAGKVAVIPNFVDTELYRPMARNNAFSKEHGLDDSFVVLYGGNVGLSQDWHSLLHAAETLGDLPILFVIVGSGAKHEWLRTEVQRRGLDNVRLLGYQPRERMPEINASSDICTIPMKTDTTLDTFPSKIYSILASARSCIVSADPDSELEWVIHEARCGRVVPPDRPDLYADAVRQAYAERDRLADEGLRGRAFVEEQYSKEAVGRRYDALIDSLLREAPERRRDLRPAGPHRPRRAAPRGIA